LEVVSKIEGAESQPDLNMVLKAQAIFETTSFEIRRKK